MPRRISADIDMKIIADLGIGLPNKDIAIKYNVSPAYVTKLKTGGKKPYIHIVQNEHIKEDDVILNNTSLNNIRSMIKCGVFEDNSDAVLVLEKQIRHHLMCASALQIALDKLKGE